jgi:CRP/FNR family transcriptional regulator, cyclic AMP receptor protein
MALVERFLGSDGKRVLLSALMQQTIVEHNSSLADRIFGIVTPIEVKQGEILAVQGEYTTGIFLILMGSISIVVNNREIKQRKAGTHVGEMTLIEPTAPRAASLVAVETSVIMSITEPQFTQLAEDYPELWRRLSLEIAKRLRQRNENVREKNTTPEVFIGSSAERISIASQIQSLLDHYAVSSVWTNGVFTASSITIDDLLGKAHGCDYAIFVISNEDRLTSRSIEYGAPRDNVVFEIGLFMGQLGRRRTFIVKERGVDLKIPSDLLGITVLEYAPGDERTLSARLGPACNEIKRQIQILGTV